MSNEQVHICTEGHVDIVRRDDTNCIVIRGKSYVHPGSVAVDLTDTGNGFIARFMSNRSTQQDYFVCLDYSQARDLVLALSAFKKELGFKNEQ